MTSDASVPELAAFIKVCSLSDYIVDPLQEVHSAHYPFKALRILKMKQNHLISLISGFPNFFKYRNLSLLNTTYEI